mgnify:CR=1 FL=1
MRSLLILLASVACASGNNTDDQAALEDQISTMSTQLEEAERAASSLAQQVEAEREGASASALAAGRLEAENAALRNASVFEGLGVSQGDLVAAVLETSMGDITCNLFFEQSPRTVLNFVELVEGNREWQDPRTGMRQQTPLYNGTIFHRVIPGFMIQGGDPVGNGTGGPGYRFPDEFNSELSFDRGGLLAMANSGPNTNGSQFFITEAPTSHLTGRHTIFGECTPLELIRTIGAVPTGSRNKPLEDVVINSIQIDRGGSDL